MTLPRYFLYVLPNAKRALCLGLALCRVGDASLRQEEGVCSPQGDRWRPCSWRRPVHPGRDVVGRLGEVLEQLGSSKSLLLCDPIVEGLMDGTLEKEARLPAVAH